MNKQQNNRTVPSEAAEMARRARHPAERPLSILSALITVLLLVFMGWNLTYSIKTPADESAAIAALSEFLEIDEESAGVLMKAQAWLVLIYFVYVYVRYWFSLFNEANRAADEDLTRRDLISQEPQEIMDRYVQILGMKDPPTLYFSDNGQPVTVNDIEAYGSKYMVLPAEMLIEDETDEKKADLHFRLATKLGNIYMGYNNIFFQVITLPGRSLPILNGLYIKSLIYSSDRMALEILARDPVDSISREDVSNGLLRRHFEWDTRQLMDNSHAMQNRDESFNRMSRIEKLMLRLGSTEPPLMDRIHTIMDPSGRPGPLL